MSLETAALYCAIPFLTTMFFVALYVLKGRHEDARKSIQHQVAFLEGEVDYLEGEVKRLSVPPTLDLEAVMSVRTSEMARHSLTTRPPGVVPPPPPALYRSIGSIPPPESQAYEAVYSLVPSPRSFRSLSIIPMTFEEDGDRQTLPSADLIPKAPRVPKI